MRLTVTLDAELLDKAKSLVKAKSKKEAIEIALKDLVRRKQLEQAIEHAGKIDMAITVEELIKLRALE